MSQTEYAVGKTMKIVGLATTKPAGYLHQIGGFVGVVIEDIVGTGATFYTGAVKGQTLSDGLGSGKGDMQIDGVFAIPVHSGIAAGLSVGSPVYYDGSNHDQVDATSGGHLAGWVFEQDDGVAVSRALDASKDPAWMVAKGGAYVAVNVRLAGHPKTGLV